jgi:hypothetical protein
MTRPLWEEASGYMRWLYRGQYNELHRCQLPAGLKRLSGVWMGFTVNDGLEEAPVQTEVQRDDKSAFFSKSCLYPLGISKEDLSFYGNYMPFWNWKLGTYSSLKTIWSVTPMRK